MTNLGHEPMIDTPAGARIGDVPYRYPVASAGLPGSCTSTM
jgi:hypothetical protein